MHPFDPWSGQTFEFVQVRRTWKQDRVFILVGDGTVSSLPTAWTDVVEPDVFVTAAAGRSAFRVEDLVALAELIDWPTPSPPPATSYTPTTIAATARLRDRLITTAISVPVGGSVW
jgi:hypothetical protein